MRTDLPYWLALNEFNKFGPRSMMRLFSYFQNMELAFKANLQDLINAGIRQSIATQFIHERQNFNPEKITDTINRHAISAVTSQDDDYPSLLKTIYDPPAVLYIKGKLPSVDRAHVAVVGSRKASSYGLQCAGMLATELAKAGVVVVSGLAYGIDEAAHGATLKSSGTTIAVLGTGILNVGSSRQIYLADQIAKRGGAVISEFPINMYGAKQNFPIRNRIISGISHGSIIIEATEKSGSLITAQSALEQNREVFALPGPITSETSVGTNNLIKMGAHPVTCAADVLNVLNISEVREITRPEPTPDSKEEALILELLSKNPIHIDELTRQTGLQSHSVAGTLSLMEMKGRTKQIGGMYYVRTI